jgi:KaiC/GvpD/RAD55 family RecA-like ATPase
MVTRGSSRRPQPARRAYADQMESAEVRRSRKAAILQLKMGRLAHIIGIASGLALALTAVIAYGLFDFFEWDFLSSLTWIIPLVAGTIVAFVALAIKWDPYVADRGEPHFVMSIASVVAPLFLIVVVRLDFFGYVDMGVPDWLYPASLLGISLTLISLAMTWEGTSSRRTISIVSAAFPVALLTFPMIFSFSDEQLASILPMGYLGSALSIQLSGSMLHIIASSTSVQQREVLRASDSKLKEQLVELDKRKRAVLYREEAQRAKESELEAYEKRLSDEMTSVEDLKAQAAANEKEIEARLQATREAREKLSRQEAEIDAKLEEVRLRQGDIDAQKRELERTAKAVAAKDSAVAVKEKDATRLLLEVQNKERDAKNKVAEVDAEAAALADMRKDLDGLQTTLSQRERDLGSRERTIELKSLEASLVKEQAGPESERTKALEKSLLAMQESLSSKELQTKAMEEEIRKKSEKAERLIARADKQMNDLIEKENAVSTRERAVTDKETSLRDALEGFNSQLEDMTMARAAVTDREKQYQELTESTKTKLSTLSAREDEIVRKMSALEKREIKIKELEERLKNEHNMMNSKLKELLEKEKDLSADEAELGLKQAELKAMEREMLESVDEVEEVREEIPEDDEREKVYTLREQKLAQKEQDLKSRLYQREKELEVREKAMQAHLKKDIEEMEETVQEEYAEKKVKSGIERLDDLLLGGMPFGSNVLFVGPPFIGKETAMLLFLAEGLKKGVPAIVVTTSHSPAELAKEIAPILPTFMEFQQLGLVHWIDASGVEGDSEFGNGNMTKVSGPGDFDGIMGAIESSMKTIEAQNHPYFRLAYFSLSMSITQAEDKKGYLFVQSLVGRAKLAQAISVFAVDRGMHTEQQLESIQHLMSGAVQFKTERQKTLLSVQGITDAQTRAWVEYKHTNKALMIGAFSLERIR